MKYLEHIAQERSLGDTKCLSAALHLMMWFLEWHHGEIAKKSMVNSNEWIQRWELSFKVYKVYCKSGTFFLLEVMAQRGCSKKREEDLPWNWRSRGVVKCSTPVLVHGLVYRILSISFLPHLSTHILVVIFVLANPFKQETSRTKSSCFFNLDRMMLAFMVVNPT